MKVGVAWREPWRADLFARQGDIDCLELTCEHVLDGTAEQRELIELLARHWLLLPHGLDLSLGSADGIDRTHLERLAPVISASRCPWWSEHLAFTRSGGRRLGHLAPLPLTREAVSVVARNVAVVHQHIATPLLLENIACPVDFPSDLPGEMDEPEFLHAVTAATGCGLLLDVSNALLGCLNRGEDFRRWLDRCPLDRVIQLHVAGFRQIDGRFIDTHADPLAAETIAAVRDVVQRCRPQAIILERDARLPPWRELVIELEALRDAC